MHKVDFNEVYRAYLYAFLAVHDIDWRQGATISELYACALAVKPGPMSPKQFLKRYRRDLPRVQLEG